MGEMSVKSKRRGAARIVKLNGDFVDLTAFAFVRKPRVRNVWPYQYQLQVADLFHTVSNDPTYALAVFYKIQFIFFMIMHWEIEFRFIPGINGKAIGLG